jgi:hypothetical protein
MKLKRDSLHLPMLKWDFLTITISKTEHLEKVSYHIGSLISKLFILNREILTKMIQDFSIPEKILFFWYWDFEIRDFAFFQSRPCLKCYIISLGPKQWTVLIQLKFQWAWHIIEQSCNHFAREPSLKRKAQYSCTSYLRKEVNCTDPSPSINEPCLYGRNLRL